MSFKSCPNFVLNLSEGEVKVAQQHYYRFKSFRLNVEERRLLRDDTPVPLTPKVFDVLAVLVERGGHLVEKDELLELVWADSFVEEHNITRVVHTLRKTLGEDENGNKFIETVAKKGYRFVAEVEEVIEPPQNSANGLAVAPADSKSDLDPAAKAVENESGFRNGAAIIDAPPIWATKPKIRIVLFAVGLLTAVSLLLLSSFNFNFGLTGKQPAPKSIAVLPLKPVAASRDEIYEIGIAESLIHRLSSMKGFVVRPLSATRKYTDINQDPIAAGREQQVDYVLASNYQIADGKIRITAQLFNISTGQIEDTYKSEKNARDIFAMQDAIAGEVGNILQTRFGTTSTGVTAKRGTANEEAYTLYLQGNNLTARRSAADAKKALEYFEQAIRLDPNFARAYSGMAFAYRASGSLGGGLPREEFEKAKAAVNKALELDSNLAEAYVAAADLKLKTERDFAGAEKDLAKAIALEPNNDLAHAIYADLLTYTGRFDEALGEIEIAQTIDPRSLVNQRNRGHILYHARRYDEAIVQLERVIELDENFITAYGWLRFSYEMKGDYAGAYETFMKRQKRANPDRVEIYQKTYEIAGWQGVKRKFLEFADPGESDLYATARYYALLGEKEQAFGYLNKALEKGSSQLVMLNVEPAFDALRDDPRFDELLRRIGFK